MSPLVVVLSVVGALLVALVLFVWWARTAGRPDGRRRREIRRQETGVASTFAQPAPSVQHVPIRPAAPVEAGPAKEIGSPPCDALESLIKLGANKEAVDLLRAYVFWSKPNSNDKALLLHKAGPLYDRSRPQSMTKEALDMIQEAAQEVGHQDEAEEDPERKIERWVQLGVLKADQVSRARGAFTALHGAAPTGRADAAVFLAMLQSEEDDMTMRPYVTALQAAINRIKAGR